MWPWGTRWRNVVLAGWVLCFGGLWLAWSAHNAFATSGDGSGGNVLSGATTTELAAPSAGTYYVIRVVSYHVTTAPTACTVLLERLDNADVLDRVRFPAVADQSFSRLYNLSLDAGLKIVNPCSQTVTAQISYDVEATASTSTTSSTTTTTSSPGGTADVNVVNTPNVTPVGTNYVDLVVGVGLLVFAAFVWLVRAMSNRRGM